MPSNRREISRRVVSRKVLGSANPVARWGRDSKSTCMDSLGGFFVGLLLFFITFAVPYSAAKTEKDSVDISKLPVTPVAEAAKLDGKGIVQGSLTAGTKVEVPASYLTRPLQAYASTMVVTPAAQATTLEGKGLVQGSLTAGSRITAPIVYLDRPILAYRYRLEESPKTGTAGNAERAWTTIDSDDAWAILKLGNITIDPAKCDMSGLTWESAFEDSFKDEDTGADVRETVEVIYANIEVLLSADFSAGQVAANTSCYAISTGTKEDLVARTRTADVPSVNLDRPILAYRYAQEENRPHIETRTETTTKVENGQDVEYTEEIEEEVWEWETINSDSKWTSLKLGTISVDHDKCDTSELKWESVFTENYTNAANGYDARESLEVIYANVDVILAAEFTGGQVVAEPDFYALSTGTKETLVARLHAAEETMRWGKIILSVILWTIAFNLMVGPAMILINIIPIKALSGTIRGVITVVSLILASIITFITYVFIKYWWVIALALVVLAVVVVMNAVKKKDADLDLDADLEAMEPDPEEGA